jgi:hypothetical protein
MDAEEQPLAEYHTRISIEDGTATIEALIASGAPPAVRSLLSSSERCLWHTITALDPTSDLLTAAPLTHSLKLGGGLGARKQR